MSETVFHRYSAELKFSKIRREIKRLAIFSLQKISACDHGLLFEKVFLMGIFRRICQTFDDPLFSNSNLRIGLSAKLVAVWAGGTVR